MSDYQQGPVTAAGASKPGVASMVGNILWVVLCGFWMAVAYVFAGIVNVVWIITIPFAVQSFKLAGYALWPFGRVVVQRPGRDAALSCIGNALWIVTGGIWLAIGHFLTGVLLCLTIIGIPFGIASFKMARLALTPFGKMIVRRDRIPVGAAVVFAPP